MNIIEKLKNTLGQLSQHQVAEIDKILSNTTTEKREFKDIKDAVDNMYNFVGPWYPISKLYYNDYKHKQIWGWCEAPAVGEGRWVSLRSISGPDPYVFASTTLQTGKTETNRLSQTVVAWTDHQVDQSPYLNEDHRTMWRQFLLNTRIKYYELWVKQ